MRLNVSALCVSSDSLVDSVRSEVKAARVGVVFTVTAVIRV